MYPFLSCYGCLVWFLTSVLINHIYSRISQITINGYIFSILKITYGGPDELLELQEREVRKDLKGD